MKFLGYPPPKQSLGTNMQNQCKFINPETQIRCDSFALESGYCFSHDPANKDKKQLAVRKGGFAPKKIKLDLPAVKIKNVDDVMVILEETINLVRSGKIPCSNPANTIGFLCSHILKAIELLKYADKIESVERILMERKIVK